MREMKERGKRYNSNKLVAKRDITSTLDNEHGRIASLTNQVRYEEEDVFLHW